MRLKMLLLAAALTAGTSAVAFGQMGVGVGVGTSGGASVGTSVGTGASVGTNVGAGTSVGVSTAPRSRATVGIGATTSDRAVVRVKRKKAKARVKVRASTGASVRH